MYNINDQYVKVKIQDENYIAYHKFTNEILYNDKTQFKSKKISEYTYNRIIELINIYKKHK